MPRDQSEILLHILFFPRCGARLQKAARQFPVYIQLTVASPLSDPLWFR